MKYQNVTKMALLCILMLLGCKQNERPSDFPKLYQHLLEQDYFSLKQGLRAEDTTLTESEKKYLQAFVFNAFNQLEESNTILDAILSNKGTNFPDSLKIGLWRLKQDNAVKQFHYKEAKEALTFLLNNFKKQLTKDDITNYENALQLWTALENAPEQKATLSKDLNLTMQTDMAGLKTLPITSDSITVPFIFDTGANLSTVTYSVAKKWNMIIYPDTIQVGSITGQKVPARIGLASSLYLDHVHFANVAFLVLEDEALSFPQIDYQIYGILGYPVMQALKQITLTKANEFSVPKFSSKYSGEQNFAMHNLDPIIQLNGKHFKLDTGADETLLFKKYFEENKVLISENHTPETINLGGAGGQTDKEGYKIDYVIRYKNRDVTLRNIPVLKEDITADWSVYYGNIGQDFIQQFRSMTLNFEDMYVDFN